jgi:hypothetical protein
MLTKRVKTASMNMETLASTKQELDEIFATVKGRDKRANSSAVKKLDENRWEIAELMVRVIEDTVTVTDPTPLLVQLVDGDIKNQDIFRELDSSLRVVNRSYGTKPLSQRLLYKEFYMQSSMKEVAVEVALEEIAVGSTTASQVTDSIASAIVRYRIAAVLDGIDAAVTAVADRTGVAGYLLRYAGFTQSNLDMAIDGLLDENETPTVMGRHVAMNPAIRGFTGWSDEVTDDLNRRGVIGEYHGANVLTLRDGFSKPDNAHVIRKDRVYLASGEKGAYWQNKDVSFLNYAVVDPRTSTFSTGIRIEDGMLVWDPYRYRVIEV